MAAPYVLSTPINIALSDQQITELEVAPGTAVTVTFTGELTYRDERRSEDPSDGSEVIAYQYNLKLENLTAIS